MDGTIALEQEMDAIVDEQRLAAASLQAELLADPSNREELAEV